MPGRNLISVGRQMNRAIVVATALGLSACAGLPRPSSDFRISNFHQGLIGQGKAGEPAVVKEGNAFPYAVNGTCNASGKRLPCMWHGFEFDYEGAADLHVLTCTVESSTPYTAVDPTKTYGEGVSTFNYPLKLKGRRGHFINPQYTVWPESKGTPQRSVTRCEYGEQEVLRFEFTIELPPNKAFQRTEATPPIK